jgi:hypothetical protein
VYDRPPARAARARLGLNASFSHRQHGDHRGAYRRQHRCAILRDVTAVRDLLDRLGRPGATANAASEAARLAADEAVADALAARVAARDGAGAGAGDGAA